MKITSTVLLLVQLAAAGPVPPGKPGSQISEVVKEGGKRLQLAGMHFPPKGSSSSSSKTQSSGPRRQSVPSAASRTSKSRMSGVRMGVTRVPGEPMGPLKKHPCCRKWSNAKRDLDCIICLEEDWEDVMESTVQDSKDVTGLDEADDLTNAAPEDLTDAPSEDLRSSATEDLGGSKGAASQGLADVRPEDIENAAAGDLAGVASEDLAAMTSNELATAASEELAGAAAQDVVALAPNGLEGWVSAASEDLAGAIAEGFPINIASDAAEPPRTDKFGWRRLGAVNKQLLYYKPGRDFKKMPTTGLKSAILLKALTLAGPSGRLGLRETVPGFKDFDDFIGRIQEFLFGPQRSDIDGNETKAILIQWFKDLAETTQPALSYQPSPYQRSYKERMDAAQRYTHPVLTMVDKCLRIWQDPHPNFMYQAYLEAINCDPLYRMEGIPDVLREIVPNENPELTPKERCQRVKESPHPNELYQSYLELINCNELADQGDYPYPLALNSGEKCLRVRQDPHPNADYQAYLIALHCNGNPRNPGEILSSLPPHGLPQPGTPQDLKCEKWVLVKDKQNCDSIAKLADVDRQKIVQWNSPNFPNCVRLWVGRYACVAVGGDE
ncbi:hypothetical protein XA68_10003 [Ophiocordyceps unilateralis]|uniref:LysM domain-containing protein n=1 Tax=Ophiocordyceps unilateralis TaxID=268505 RepID=A0A2A9PRA4_OPHUN|nr:hypothetical protein XA68_10003 [Ophiocordyceps unilateralis]